MQADRNVCPPTRSRRFVPLSSRSVKGSSISARRIYPRSGGSRFVDPPHGLVPKGGIRLLLFLRLGLFLLGLLAISRNGFAKFLNKVAALEIFEDFIDQGDGLSGLLHFAREDLGEF